MEFLRFSGNKIHCSPRDQSLLSVKYYSVNRLSSQRGAKRKREEDPFSLSQFPLGHSSRGQTLPPEACFKANSIFTFRPCRSLFLCFCSDAESFVYSTLFNHSIHVKAVGFFVVWVVVFSVLESPTSFPLGCV